MQADGDLAHQSARDKRIEIAAGDSEKLEEINML
jgi:hypothetical protein